MHAEDMVDPIHRTGANHGPGAATTFFARLKDQPDLAFQLRFHVFQQCGNTQSHRHMAVVTTGVGCTGIDRGEPFSTGQVF